MTTIVVSDGLTRVRGRVAVCEVVAESGASRGTRMAVE